MIQIDMPMPENCVECRFSQGEYGFCYAMPPNFCGYVNDFEEDGRTKWCPLKAQEPRLVTEADFENADEYGFIPVWTEETSKNSYWDHWNCIPIGALETAKEDGCRYWTSKPSLKQMEETPWE